MNEILDALHYGTEHSAQNSLLFGEARDPSAWRRITTSPYYAGMLEELRKTGEEMLKEPIRCIPFSLYRLFDTTGERKAYEEEYFYHRKRVSTFAMLAMAYGGDTYIHALEDALWAVCDEYNWCLPAHMYGSLDVIGPRGQNLSAPADHPYILDLFASETAVALSEILYLFSGRLAPLVAARVKEEVMRHVITPYYSLRPNYWWETTEMNWAAVCAGSIGMAAMYLIGDDGVLCPVLHRVLSTLNSFLSGFPDDGSCLEGVGYWNYGFGFFVYFACLLKERTAGKLDLMGSEKVKLIAQFQQKCYMSDGFVMSYSDVHPAYNYRLALTHKLKSLYPEVIEVPKAPSAHWNVDDFFPGAVRDLVWTNEAYAGNTLRDAFYHFDNAGIIVSRKKVKGNFLAFSAKGGHNDEPHNHNDLGSFILQYGRQPLLTDPGSDVYCKDYFNENRYQFIHSNSLGHSVPIIEGLKQKEGREHCAAVMNLRHSDAADEFELDLTRAYDDPNLNAFTRAFLFDKAGLRLTVTDKYSFQAQPTSLTERFVAFIQPEEVKPGLIRLAQGDVAAEISYDPAKLAYSLDRKEFAPETGLDTLYLMDLQVKSPAQAEQVSVEITVLPL